jgi:transcriptional regulator with XRE-family HTH domain
MKRDEFEGLFAAPTEAEQIAEDALLLGFRFLSIIDRLMEEKGLTKKSLAAKIGASPSYITQLFRGNVRVNLEFIAKAEKALGIKFHVGLDLKEARGEGISLKESEKLLPESGSRMYSWDESLENMQNDPIAA